MANEDKFTGISEIYAKYRPKYPSAAIAYITEGLEPDASIADVGAGTGKFTKALLEFEFNVMVVEPNTDMLTTAKKELGGYHCQFIQASAEDTHIPNSTVDLVTVAQAFHWFDRECFAKECLRVLKPEGKVGLIYNHRDADHPSVQSLKPILQRYCPKFPGFSGGIKLESIEAFFNQGNYETRTFPNPDHLSEEEFIGRILSNSWALKPVDLNYETFCDALKEHFAAYQSDGKVLFQNKTTIYLGKLTLNS